MARKTHVAPVLTLHRGGADPVEQLRDIERAQEDAHDALLRLGLMLPESERLRRSMLNLADALGECPFGHT